MTKLFLFLFPLLFTSTIALSQNDCERNGWYSIDSIGDDSGKLGIGLDFLITSDSITMYPGGYRNKRILFGRENSLAKFRITERKCNWKYVYQNGVITYKLLLIEEGREKQPILNIIFNGNGSGYIELLYNDNEKRLFSIFKFPDQ